MSLNQKQKLAIVGMGQESSASRIVVQNRPQTRQQTIVARSKTRSERTWIFFSPDLAIRHQMERPMFCQGCGKELPVDASFCPGCGRSSGGKMADTDAAKFPVRDFLEAETPQELNAIAMSDDGASFARFAQKYKAYGADPDFIDDSVKLARMRDGIGRPDFDRWKRSKSTKTGGTFGD